jgi:hypothetical protein
MSLKASLVCTALGAGMLALSGVNASAAIACTGNVCWHVQERYDYPPSARIVVHEDDWRAGPGILSANTKAVVIGTATAGPIGKIERAALQSKAAGNAGGFFRSNREAAAKQSLRLWVACKNTNVGRV